MLNTFPVDFWHGLTLQKANEEIPFQPSLWKPFPKETHTSVQRVSPPYSKNWLEKHKYLHHLTCEKAQCITISFVTVNVKARLFLRCLQIFILCNCPSMVWFYRQALLTGWEKGEEEERRIGEKRSRSWN